MNNKVYAIGVAFYTIIPLIIITQRHLRYEDGGYRYGFMGIILAITVLHFTVFKKVENRVNTWDIQNRNKDKVVLFRGLKPIIIISIFTYLTYSVSLNIDTIMWTLVYIIASMLIGFGFEYSAVVLHDDTKVKEDNEEVIEEK